MNSEPINQISVKHHPICETTLIESFKNFLIAERGEVQRWQKVNKFICHRFSRYSKKDYRFMLRYTSPDTKNGKHHVHFMSCLCKNLFCCILRPKQKENTTFINQKHLNKLFLEMK